MGSGRTTGVAWSPLFAAHPGRRGAAFLPPQPLLPNDPWDRGDRVGCLRDALRLAAGPIAGRIRHLAAEPARVDELLEFHTVGHLRRTGLLGPDPLDTTARAALHAVGAARELCRRVWDRRLSNGYALVRPAGHHAGSDAAGGGCLLGNGVLAVLEARRLGARRVLVLDWDAHHGNSQQDAFWEDPGVLTISLHQGRSYAPGTGGTDARGGGAGGGATLNVPLPPGSGGGAYRAAFERVVEPAADRFRPDFVLVASGLDAGYIDPSARLSLHSGDFGWMADRMVDIADRYAGGRLLLTHEGGYALAYLPLCFLRIVESLTGERSGIEDPFLRRWGEDFATGVSAEARAVLAHCARLAAEVPAA